MTGVQTCALPISLTSVGGCRNASSEMIIDFIPSLFPNVITPYPSSPGKNDYFEIQGLPPNSSIVIYNRWGEKVFEAANYQNNWDANGLSDGTYYYILTMNGKGYKGYVQVLRD